MVDPGVFISALLSDQGAPSRLVQLLASGEFELVVSEALVGELSGVLARPKFAARVSLSDGQAFLAFVRTCAMLVDDPAEPEPIAPDPKDDYLLALADASSATHLVTGDRSLRAVSGRSFALLTPRAFLDELSEARPAGD